MNVFDLRPLYALRPRGAPMGQWAAGPTPDLIDLGDPWSAGDEIYELRPDAPLLAYVARDGAWVPPAPPLPPLGPEQQAAYDAIVHRQTCFITGPAGTGKTECIMRAVADLRAQGRAIAMTGSTGVAAVHAGGVTIHSFLGTGRCSSHREALKHFRTLKSDAVDKARKRIDRVHMIVVDEVSMLTGDYIGMMDWWLRRIKYSDKPFGGIPVVFVGDLLQLPPVVTPDDEKYLKNKYAFQSAAWLKNVRGIYLRKGYRQDDAEFRKHLMRIRSGSAPDDTLEYFNQRVGAELEDPDPMLLFPMNRETDAVNAERFDHLRGQIVKFAATFTGHPGWQDMLRKNAPVDVDMELKLGAAVLVTKNNFSFGYHNGMRGTIVDFTKDGIKVKTVKGATVCVRQETWETKDASGAALASMTQYPLRLAWAMTVHRGQGATVDALEYDPTSSFERGQCYVALSRVRSLTGLRLTRPLKSRYVRASQLCVDYYRTLLKEPSACLSASTSPATIPTTLITTTSSSSGSRASGSPPTSTANTRPPHLLPVSLSTTTSLPESDPPF
jgi:hypothetical protein